MAETTETRRIIIKVDASGAKEAEVAARQMATLNSTVKDLAGGMGFLTKIAKGLGTAFVINEIRNFIQDVINTGVELKNMSQAVGISVEDLAKLKVAAQLSGVPMENLTVAMRRLNVNIIQAATGNNVIEKSFEAFGVSVRDAGGHVRSATEVLLSMADKFKSLADGPAKSALAIKLFGRSGSDIIPILNLGREAIEKFSLHIDTEFATAAKEFNNNILLMKLETKNLALEFFASLLPALNAAIEKFDEYSIKSLEVHQKSRALSGIVTLLAIAFKTVYEVVGVLVDLIWASLVDALDISIGAIKILIKGINELADRANALRNGDFKDAFSLDSSKTVDAWNEMWSKIDKTGENFSTKAKNRFLDLMNYSRDLEDKLEFGYDKPGAGLPKPQADASGINKKLDHERQLLEILKAQGVEQRQLQELELKKYSLTAVEYENEKDRYKTQQDIIKATKDFNLKNPQEADLARQYRTEAQLQEKAREQNRLALEEQKHGFEGFKVGATEAFKSYTESAMDAAAQTKTLFMDAFKGMEDGLYNFVKTGKFNFASFATAIIDDIIRIQVRMALAGLLTSVVGAFGGGSGSGGLVPQAEGATANLAANGGIMSSNGMLPLHNYASGGIAKSPQVAIFGEGRMNEAYVPLPNGRSIPVEMNGGGSTNVVVNVNMESGQTSSSSDSARAEKIGRLVSVAVKKELIKEKRSGGLIGP